MAAPMQINAFLESKMELLQKALFNMPRAAAAANNEAQKPMDKLGLSQFYAGAAAAAGHHPLAAAAAAAPGLGGVEAVSPNIVFDVASLVLYGTHAIPVRLKILLDRLFSVLREEEVVQILKGYGWTMEDYQRGYILKDPRGAPLERWTMCSREEEPLVLQQFLRFGETRPITQQLLLQELSDRQNEEQRARAQHEIKRLIERNSAAAAAAANSLSAPRTPTTPPTTPLLANTNGLGGPSSMNLDSKMEPKSPASLKRSSSPLSSSAHSPPPSFSHSQLSPKMSYISTSNPSSSGNMNGGSSSTSTSPLNRLQNMQPFDYRSKANAAAESMQRAAVAAAAAAAIERPMPPNMPSMRIPPSAAMTGPLGLPILPNVSGVHSSLAASYHNTIANMANKAHKEAQRAASEELASSNALNLSGASQSERMRSARDSLDRSSANSVHSRGSDHGHSSNTNNYNCTPGAIMKKSTRPSSDPHAGEDGIQQEMKKKFRDNIGISYVSPTTGKKRVQCNVCLKTFCDKGALKIHFSAVHLREMHKCSVDGCNMMFSSRRSRNRHSANPNPKLHTPHLRRKISPHDGRTHQGPYLPGLAGIGPAGVSPGSNDASPSGMSPLMGGPMGLPPQFAGVPPSMLPPELQNLQRQQLELQRFHEMKMSQMYKRGDDAASSGGEETSSLEAVLAAKRQRMSDSDNDIEHKLDDDKSIGEHSGKDETSSGTQSVSGGGGGAGGRKRKSQNPTRITTMASPSAVGGNGDGDENFSSDDDDEGFENPLDDNDDDIDNFGDDDDDDDHLGGNGGSGGAGPGSRSGSQGSPGTDKGSSNGRGGNGDGAKDDNGNGKSNSGDSPSSPKDKDGLAEEDEHRKTEKDDLEESNNNGVDPCKEDMSDRGSCTSPSMESNSILMGDIPVDKENPLRCIECGEEFPNHFAVKTHFQEAHLKLMHKCTIEGCNAGFPSKRSRDRHSSNLNLHRKLLSTSSDKSPGSGGESSLGVAGSAANYQSELLARLYAENAAAAAGGDLLKNAVAAGAVPGGPFGMLPFNAMGFSGLAALQNAAGLGSPMFGMSGSAPTAGPPGGGGLLAQVGNQS